MTAPVPADLADNTLIGRLPLADRQRLAAHMLAVDLPSGETIHEAGDDVVETWFPTGAAMVSFCVESSAYVDPVVVALVGCEGAVGGIVSHGLLPAYASARVQFGGRFLRIRTATLEQAKQESLTLRRWISSYSDCLLAQVFQTAACNATHTIVQRTARWLLAASSRTEDEFHLTQDQLAEMLGVGRTYVTRTLRRLREDGVIRTRRGRIKILDESALRRISCDCSIAIEEHFETVLGGVDKAA